MKKFRFLLVIVFCAIVTSVHAQNSSNALVGIWQLCSMYKNVDGQHALKARPIWKIINSDGTFTQFLMSSYTSEGGISHIGTYKVTEDNEYIEHITDHERDERIIGTDTKIKYRLINEDLAIFTYALQTSTGGTYEEIWRRVKLVHQY